jgi:hypothetical protein
VTARFDKLLVGSSPGMMLEACVHAGNGARVGIVDRSERPGGAWATLDLLATPGIESGPHFFQSRADLAFLAGSLDFRLMRVPRPFWMVSYRGLRFRATDRGGKLFVGLLQLARLALKGRRRLRDVPDDRVSRLGDILRQMAFHLSSYRESTDYFAGGCGDFVRSAAALAVRRGVEFRHGDLEAVRCADGALTCKLSSGERIECRELLVTCRSVLPVVETEAGPRTFNVVEAWRNQLHLLVRSPRPIDFYLVRFVGYGMFAVVNLSLIGNHRSTGGASALAVTLSDMSEARRLDREFAQATLDRLVRAGLLAEGTELLQFESTRYRDFRMTPHDYAAIERMSGGRIRKVGDVDLAVWLKDLAARWN